MWTGARRGGWVWLLAGAGALLLASAAGAGEGTSGATLAPADLLDGIATPAGDFLPPERCAPADDGGFTLTVQARNPGTWGGCCVELSAPVALSPDSCPKLEVRLREPEANVEIKFEEGAFGTPTRTAWLRRGPMGKGPHPVKGRLQTTLHQPIPKMNAVRMCVAIVGLRGPASNELTVSRAVALAGQRCAKR